MTLDVRRPKERNQFELDDIREGNPVLLFKMAQHAANGVQNFLQGLGVPLRRVR